MDEFTKSDLYVLLKCVRLCEIEHGECPDLDYVKLKLQKIIDQYCDHAHKQYYEYVLVYECNNCHLVRLR